MPWQVWRRGSDVIIPSEAIDLLKKYEATERELTELKAASLPRRLSSAQKLQFRTAIAGLSQQSLMIFCVGSGAEIDFEQDFVEAAKDTPPLREYSSSCSVMVGPQTSFSPPLLVEVGTGRRNDGEVLLKALADMGIKRKEIAIRNNSNSAYPILTIGPKGP